MQILSQVHLSTFDAGKTFTAEVRVGDTFVNLTEGALRTLLAAHKSLGGTVRKFPARNVVVRNAERAARYGRKVGDTIPVTDYATDRLRFEATVGDGVCDDPRNIEVVNSFSVDGASLDLGEVREVAAAAKPARQAQGQAAEADDLG